MAVAFAVAAFAVWLAGKIGTVWALIAMAALFLGVMLIVQGVAWLAFGRPRRAPPSPPPPVSPVAASAEASGEEGAVPPGSEIGAVAIVALIGFLLGRQMLQR